MSLYPTGVTVVTTAPEGHIAFGLTVNSFTSLSLDPPLVMWNLQKSSDTYKAWHDADSFAVNFLKAEQTDVCRRYATMGEHELREGDFVEGVSACPLLTDCLASLECKMHARYEEGDHVIIIGEVVNITSQAEADPMVFVKGIFTKAQ